MKNIINIDKFILFQKIILDVTLNIRETKKKKYDKIKILSNLLLI